MKKADVGFGVIVSTRGFFNPKLAYEGRMQLLAKLGGMGYETICLDESETRYGLVETMDDAQKCAELFKKNAEKIQGIIVCLPNFGDEVGVVSAIDKAGLHVPVLVQACDDERDKMDLAGRRDAFCGKISVCNNLNQYGIKFTNTTYHTCAIDSEVFTEDISNFAKVCRITAGLKGLRVAQMGTRPAAFQTVRYSEKLLQTLGIQVIPVDMSEIIFAAGRLEMTEDVAAAVDKIKSYGRMEEGVQEESIVKQAKLYVTVRDWMRENDCRTGTIQCWDSIQINYGCAACLTMSMLGEEGMPMACEVDVMGAVTMYAMYLASGSPSGYLDWNNSYGEDRDMCIGIHCSNFPKSFINGDFEIGSLDILGNSLGRENCFGACKTVIAPGEMTYGKISTDDEKGRVKMYVGEGSFVDDEIDTLGGVAICRVPGLQPLMDYICGNGFEHHVAMNRGRSAHVLAEALGKYMGVDVYCHDGKGAVK